MKNILAVIFFMLICSLNYSGFGQTHKLDSVKIECEGFYTETIADVTCDAFDYVFKDTKKIKVMTSMQNLSAFESLLKSFKSAKNRSFDVRGKICYYQGKHLVKYCFDTFGYFSNDGKLYHNKGLLIVISNLLYHDHPEYLDTLKYQ